MQMYAIFSIKGTKRHTKISTNYPLDSHLRPHLRHSAPKRPENANNPLFLPPQPVTIPLCGSFPLRLRLNKKWRACDSPFCNRTAESASRLSDSMAGSRKSSAFRFCCPLKPSPDGLFRAWGAITLPERCGRFQALGLHLNNAAGASLRQRHASTPHGGDGSQTIHKTNKINSLTCLNESPFEYLSFSHCKDPVLSPAAQSPLTGIRTDTVHY